MFQRCLPFVEPEMGRKFVQPDQPLRSAEEVTFPSLRNIRHMYKYNRVLESEVSLR